MPWPSMPISKLAGRAAQTVGGGSAGWLGALTTIHRPSVAVVAAAVFTAAAITNGLPKVAESIFKRRSEIIKAKGEAKASRIKAKGETKALTITAKSEAKNLTRRTKTRTKLLLAGMEPGNAQHAGELLRQDAINVDLPERRRLSDETLANLLATHRTRSTGKNPDSAPRGVIVVPIRPDD
jgi:hypothetical protein